MHYLLIVLLLVGCTSLGDKMASWMGHHRDELITAWGPPAQETALSDGSTVMVYVKSRGGGFVPVAGILAAIPPRTCEMQFVAKPDGYLKSWTYRNC